MKYLIILLAFTNLLSAHPEPLEVFLRSLFEESEAGYVMYGVKPISITGISVKDDFCVECDHHKDSCDIYEGIKVWSHLNPKNDNLIIHLYQLPDSGVPRIRHVLIINKELFLETVQNEIALFKSMLGPSVTPQTLLDELISPQATWHEVLKDSKLLIGILLGFGTNNSIYESRLEALEGYIHEGENVPFKGKIEALEITNKMYADSLFAAQSRKVTAQLAPSFGYNSIKEEYFALISMFECSSLQLVQEQPRFVFGRLKNDSETEHLIPRLEATQKKIQELLASKNFVDQVLEAFGCDKPKSSTKATPCNWTKLVAAHIWDSLFKKNETYQNNFLSGMQSSTPPISVDFDLVRHAAINHINANLEETRELFQALESDPSFISLVDEKLYYKTLKNGSEDTLKGVTEALISYAITAPDDETLVEKRKVWVNIKDFIPGLTKGIIGMQKGEIREIFIHPSLAYGYNTAFEKGISFQAKVELHDFDETFEEFTLYELEMPPLESTHKIDESFDLGYHCWQHYKKSNLYTLKEVLEHIANFKKGEDHTIYLNRDHINTLHWMIYNTINDS